MHHCFDQKTIIRFPTLIAARTTSAQKGDPGVHLQTTELAIGMASVTIVRQHRANSPFEELNLLRSLLSRTGHHRREDTTAKPDQVHRQISILLMALGND